MWDTVAIIATVAVALAALLFSFFTFKSQLKQSERVARANIKPLLSMKSLNYSDLKSICINNYGIGPAVVTKAEFCRERSESTDRIVDLFDLPVKNWDTFTNLPPKRAIPEKAEVILVKLSLKRLLSDGVEEGKAFDLLKKWNEQKSGIEIKIEYEDILGNRQEPLVEILN